MITVRRWVNSIAVSIPSGMPYEPSHLEADFNRIKSVLTGGYPSFAHAQEDIESVFNSPIDFIKSIPSPPVSMQPLASTPSSVLSSTFRPNTAFILMWMNLARPELQDVVNTFKGVFALFGIQSLRSDDIEHQDVLTEMVLQHIRSSEFLVADLTGERPNVYYEVGYAHAVGKRPILYRRKTHPCILPCLCITSRNTLSLPNSRGFCSGASRPSLARVLKSHGRIGYHCRDMIPLASCLLLMAFVHGGMRHWLRPLATDRCRYRLSPPATLFCFLLGGEFFLIDLGGANNRKSETDHPRPHVHISALIAPTKHMTHGFAHF